jgi:hypothetical protein
MGITPTTTGDSNNNVAKSEIWLPFLDTYRTMCRFPDPTFRQLLENVGNLRFGS